MPGGGRDPGHHCPAPGRSRSRAVGAPGMFGSGAAAGIRSPTGASDEGPGIATGRAMARRPELQPLEAPVQQLR